MSLQVAVNTGKKNVNFIPIIYDIVTIIKIIIIVSKHDAKINTFDFIKL